MEHFKADDFANRMEYESGFTTRLYLKRDAVPSIYNTSIDEDDHHKEREQRSQKRENKKIVEQLLKEHDAASALANVLEESETLVHSKESEDLVAKSSYEQDKGHIANCGNNNEICNLKNEIERLRKENFELNKNYNKKISEVKSLAEKRWKERKVFEYKFNNLKTYLTKTNFELRNLEEKLLGIFSKVKIKQLNQNIKENARSHKKS